MSYARWGENSSVYVYAHVGGFVECCGCKLSDDWEHHSAADVVAHMEEHVTAGDRVPAYLLDAGLYPDGDFIAMCDVFMCREQVWHEGEHTPLVDERYREIRAKQIGGRDE